MANKTNTTPDKDIAPAAATKPALDLAAAHAAVTIGPAVVTDYRALRLLLPDAFYFGSDARGFVARINVGGKIAVIGAAALSGAGRADPVPGLRMAIEVAPPFRHRGTGTRLTEACRKLASASGALAMYAWDPVLAESPSAAGYRALGFDQVVALRETRVKVADSVDKVERLYARLAERKRVPPGTRIIDLPRADAAVVARLYQAHIGGDYANILRTILGESSRRYHGRLSMVLMLDEQVVGFWLAFLLEPGVLFVDATAVLPKLRGGWANVLLKREAAERCRAMGVHTLLYYTYGRHRDTRKFSADVNVNANTRELIEPYRMI